jgi:hypothetical protein
MKLKQAIDDDIEDYFAMQERKTAKGKPAAAAVHPGQTRDTPDPPAPIEDLDITVEESPGEDGLDTIVEKVKKFWDRS